MNIPLVNLKAQYQSIKNQVSSAIEQSLDEMGLFLGKNVVKLEEEFSSFCGTKYGVGVGSGTSALHLSLRALGIGPGDEVITVANSFIATAEAIAHAGAIPVFVDVKWNNALMDLDMVESKITRRTKAILPVHLYGQMVPMDELLKIADQHGLKIIEDASQAHGASFKGKKAGSWGDAGCFSFYFSKNLGAYGEGGMIVTSNPEMVNHLRLLRNHGSESKYIHKTVGYNERLDEIQAAILRVKLPFLEGWNQRRELIANIYNKRLEKIEGINLFQVQKECHSVYHLYVIKIKERDTLKKYLEERGVATGIHYPVPIHLQKPFYQKGKRFKVTEMLCNEILSLPMYPELTEKEAEYVCDIIEEFASERDSEKTVGV